MRPRHIRHFVVGGLVAWCLAVPTVIELVTPGTDWWLNVQTQGFAAAIGLLMIGVLWLLIRKRRTPRSRASPFSDTP